MSVSSFSNTSMFIGSVMHVWLLIINPCISWSRNCEASGYGSILIWVWAHWKVDSNSPTMGCWSWSGALPIGANHLPLPELNLSQEARHTANWSVHPWGETVCVYIHEVRLSVCTFIMNVCLCIHEMNFCVFVQPWNVSISMMTTNHKHPHASFFTCLLMLSSHLNLHLFHLSLYVFICAPLFFTCALFSGIFLTCLHMYSCIFLSISLCSLSIYMIAFLLYLLHPSSINP